MNKIINTLTLFIILFSISSCREVNESTFVVPNSTRERSSKSIPSTNTATLTLKSTIEPTFTPSNILIPSITSINTLLPPTKTPIDYIPQIYIGITETDVQIGACGDSKTIWTMNYGGDGEEITFWDYYPSYPKPMFDGKLVIYGTRDWRGNMDICVYPGRAIIAQHYGIVLENRVHLFTPEKQDCLLAIDLSLDGLSGYELILAHFNPDIDQDAEGIQAIEAGTKIEPGTLLGYTHQYKFNGLIHNPVLNIGLFNSNSSETTYFSYWFNQDLSLVGPDGQLNLVRP